MPLTPEFLKAQRPGRQVGCLVPTALACLGMGIALPILGNIRQCSMHSDHREYIEGLGQSPEYRQEDGYTFSSDGRIYDMNYRIDLENRRAFKINQDEAEPVELSEISWSIKHAKSALEKILKDDDVPEWLQDHLDAVNEFLQNPAAQPETSPTPGIS